MCGIAGFFAKEEQVVLEAMAKKMAHRGPDDQGLFYSSERRVGLSHARLAIQDLSSAGHQPMFNAEKSIALVFNGEIYNFPELRSDLKEKGYQFRGRSDTEVLLAMYQEHGTDVLSHIEGMFAFAIYDFRNDSLFLARDPFGIKPLYYAQLDQGFYFSSEIKSLLEVPAFPKDVNFDAVLQAIVFLWNPGPDTVLKSVKKLAPGTFLIVEQGQVTKHERYWTWPIHEAAEMNLGQAVDRVDQELRSSMSSQLISDAPVGSFLSGGLDSSTLVAMAKESYPGKMQCFTLNAVDETKSNDGFPDDLPYAKQVAEYLNVDLEVIEASSEIVKFLPKMIYHLDEPQADPAPWSVFAICMAARRHGIKVLFSGAGGDDLFTGYRRHRALLLERYWSWLPGRARTWLQKVARMLPKRSPTLRRVSKAFSNAGLPANERLLSYFYWIDPVVVRDLFVDDIRDQLSPHPMSAILESLTQRGKESELEKMLFLEKYHFLVDHNLNYTDKMSMACGVEVRVPFLSKGLATLCAKLPVHLKQKGRHGKWVLKKVAERYLPMGVIYRPKAGFGAPLRAWLQGDLKTVVDDLLGEESIRSRGLFKSAAVRRLVEQDRLGQEDYAYPIFSLLCIEIWFRIFIDRKTDGMPDGETFGETYGMAETVC